ncbi:MAG TPA: AAA family ATPase [Chthoniobacterales bacterium]|nr:AAA family ATPase [Chthoniobacterales bacterium]
MIKASNSPQPESTLDEAPQAVCAILVSRVKNATDVQPTDCSATEIVAQVRSGEGTLRERVLRIRNEYWRVMSETNNDRKVAKTAVDKWKKSLPAAMWSGTFSRRKQNALLQHSGLLCADLDAIGTESLTEVRAKLQRSMFLWALFTSPTGDGLKAVFRIPAEAEKHEASFRAVEKHVAELANLPIDEKCSDVSRLCFLSHDPDAYFNPNAGELPVTVEAKPKREVKTEIADEKLQRRREIAEEVLGEINWDSNSAGYCTCPAQHLHNTGDGGRDCEVYLDRVPTLHCFHESCLGVVAGVNHELRSRIGKSESTGNRQNIETAASIPIQLPDIVSADQFLKEKLEIPAELVSGLIHAATTGMFAGGSKTCKTFTMLDLGISVSQGVQWWGRDVQQGRVLYVNFELAPAFLQQRLFALADAKGVGVLDADGLVVSLPNFDIWNLRGYATDVKQLMPRIIDRCRGHDYSMIILDPIYKLMGGRNENDAGQMTEVLNEFDALAHEVGAAVVYSHHFAKGSASNKEQIDRASGSGVFGRQPDSIVTLTAHEEDSAFVVEATLRNLPAPKAFVVRWAYPLMQMARELDPKKLKKRRGARTQYTVGDILGCLVDGMTTGQWKEAAIDKEGLAASTFAKLKKEAVREGRVQAKGNEWVHIPVIHAVNPMTGESKVRVAAPHERINTETAA